VRRPHPEVADIFCSHGSAYRRGHRGHLSLGQLKAMSAIERCRTCELGGHKLHCDHCGTDTIAYNSCRNRHCPKCQATAAARWLERQQHDVLPVPYFHVVFTLPEPLRRIAYQNQRVIYDLLFKCVSQTLLTIAGDKRHLGAKPGITAVLHTWGSNMSFHPHLHCIVTGGGLRGDQWIACRKNFFLPVKVLSRHFRYRFLSALRHAYNNGELHCFGDLQTLEDPEWFDEHLRPLKSTEWIVYAKAPFAGPEAVLTYLSRYTHRVAISNRRLVRTSDHGVTFRYKDYRDGKTPWRSMTIRADEFIRRFLLHILPRGFHRIRHYGLLANARRNDNLRRARQRLAPQSNDNCAPKTEDDNETRDKDHCAFTCRQCGEPLIIVAILLPQHAPRAPPQGIAA
jgi:predicted RNA-binding Zn-ribbon protein involved in translation (DUF1610 family)